MKFFKFFIVAILVCAALFSFTSYRTKADTNASHLFEGKWEGSYGFGKDAPNVYYAFHIQPDGTLEEVSQSGNLKGCGTWKMNGDTFTATYQWKEPMNSSYTVVATYDATTERLTGTWGYKGDATNGGLWEQSK